MLDVGRIYLAAILAGVALIYVAPKLTALGTLGTTVSPFLVIVAVIVIIVFSLLVIYRAVRSLFGK
ncbi:MULTISPECIES: hypothetical protein [Bacillus]|uniref:hypothetical protein n=1 Tax=Bacillus TaxID=1386 RepID=UPI000BB947AA|nr:MULTISPECIES: hypothetical protein [Bacillus]